MSAYKEPTKEQMAVMQEFAEVCSNLLEIIMRYDSNLSFVQASIKVNEAMHWFHSAILNFAGNDQKTPLAN